MPRVVHLEIHATDPETPVGFHAGRFGRKLSRWGEMPCWPMPTDPAAE